MSALMSVFLLIWDGFHLIGEGFGFTHRRADQFADVAWLAVVLLLVAWLGTLLTCSLEMM